MTHFLPGLGNTVFPSQRNVNPEPPPARKTLEGELGSAPFGPSCSLAVVLSNDRHCQAEFPGVCSSLSFAQNGRKLFFLFSLAQFRQARASK